MRTLLICHGEEALHREGIARWLASWSTLTGVLVIEEPTGTLRRRIRRELRRVGALRFLDVLAFRLFHRFRWGRSDARWARERLATMRASYPELPLSVKFLRVSSPNGAEAVRFIRECQPDLMLALCKTILQPRVFGVPTHGTWVLHPGICPEYRNAHGCFWALVHDDREKVGMTMLRIDEGVDTGPVHAYFRAAHDEERESHVVLQHRVVLDNLDGIREAFERIGRGELTPIDTSHRRSSMWGQPWLSAYLKWRLRTRRRRRAISRAAVS